MTLESLQELFERQEELHPDLVDHIEPTDMGDWLKHPLMFIPFYTPQQNAYCNAQYKAKKEYVEKALTEKNYSSYIWMHERPYRLEKFTQIRNEISDKEYWELLSNIWSDSENLWQYGAILGTLINSSRPGRENMMDDSEHQLLADLPEEFIVYRGHQVKNKLGYSWTLSYFRAKWFAQRFNQSKHGVVSATVKKKDVVAVLLGRNEFEVICHPKNLDNVQTIPKNRRPQWIESVYSISKTKFSLDQMYHGFWHWEKVEKNALAIAKETPNADPVVSRLFALIHDSHRNNDDHDPEHGHRAAIFAQELFDQKLLKISKDQLLLLKEACAYHNDGKVSQDPTIGACWDADRLDLIRVGIIPDPQLLSTQAGKNLLWKI